MTENDTFNVLKRIPYEDIDTLWMTTLHGDFVRFLIDNGWTWTEFVKEWNKTK